MKQEDERDALRAISAAEAFAGFENAGDAQTSVRMPDFRGPEAWLDLASFSVCQRTGTAADLSLSGDAVLEKRGTIRLNGQGDYAGPRRSITAAFRVLTPGHYACAARLQRATLTFAGACAFKVDGAELTTRSIGPQPAVYSFIVHFTGGDHHFTIEERQATVWFYGLRIFEVPILSPS